MHNQNSAKLVSLFSESWIKVIKQCMIIIYFRTMLVKEKLEPIEIILFLLTILTGISQVRMKSSFLETFFFVQLNTVTACLKTSTGFGPPQTSPKIIPIWSFKWPHQD